MFCHFYFHRSLSSLNLSSLWKQKSDQEDFGGKIVEGFDNPMFGTPCKPSVRAQFSIYLCMYEQCTSINVTGTTRANKNNNTPPALSCCICTDKAKCGWSTFFPILFYSDSFPLALKSVGEKTYAVYKCKGWNTFPINLHLDKHRISK